MGYELFNAIKIYVLSFLLIKLSWISSVTFRGVRTGTPPITVNLRTSEMTDTFPGTCILHLAKFPLELQQRLKVIFCPRTIC